MSLNKFPPCFSADVVESTDDKSRHHHHRSNLPHQQAKIEVLHNERSFLASSHSQEVGNFANTDDVGYGDDNLEEEIKRLCAEIENSNGNNMETGNVITKWNDNADTMDDLTFNEGELLRSIMDRVRGKFKPLNLQFLTLHFLSHQTEEKVVCETFKRSLLVDKAKLDSLFDERNTTSSMENDDNVKALQV